MSCDGFQFHLMVVVVMVAGGMYVALKGASNIWSPDIGH